MGLRNSMALLEKSDGRQGRKNKIGEIAIGDIKRIVNAAFVAETTDFQIVMGQL